MNRRVGFAVLVGAALLPAMALATQQGDTLIKRWLASDKCAAQAQKAFPDYTAEALAKRDEAFKKCLASQNLPPHD